MAVVTDKTRSMPWGSESLPDRAGGRFSLKKSAHPDRYAQTVWKRGAARVFRAGI